MVQLQEKLETGTLVLPLTDGTIHRLGFEKPTCQQSTETQLDV